MYSYSKFGAESWVQPVEPERTLALLERIVATNEAIVKVLLPPDAIIAAVQADEREGNELSSGKEGTPNTPPLPNQEGADASRSGT